jgi:hypothetical protein
MQMSKMVSHDPFGHLKHKLWPKGRCCGHQLTQKLEITLEAPELEPITQQLTQN